MTKPFQYLTLACLFGGSLIAGLSVLTQVFALTEQHEEYSHIVLVLPIVGALFWLNWKSITTKLSSAKFAGNIALGLAIVLAILGQKAQAVDIHLALMMFALVTWWLGCFIFGFGLQAFHAAFFPLTFLYWLVPWPQGVLDVVVSWLQYESAQSARLLFTLARIPVSLDGITLILPGLTLNVAPECSSIRSSLLLIITTMIFAHLFLKSFWRKFALVLAAILLSPAKNGLRIFVIGYFAVRDQNFLHGWLHLHGGFIFLGIAQLIIFLLLWLLNRGERSSAPGFPKPLTTAE